MVEKNENKIILEIQVPNFPNLYKNVNKYYSFITHLLEEQTEAGFTLEIIHNGLLYIYKNRDMFRSLNPRYSEAMVNKYKNEHENKVSPNLLTDGVIDKDNFPKEGLIFKYKVIGTQIERLKKILTNHIDSFRDPNIVLEFLGENNFVLRIKTFSSLLFYTSFLASLIDGMVKEYIKKYKD